MTKLTICKARYLAGFILGLAFALSACAKNERNPDSPVSPDQKPAGVVATPPPAGENNGTGVGNGGGAIIRNGKILTLAQAGISIPLFEVEKPVDEIPEISIVENLILRLAISDSMRGNLLHSLLPSTDRKYFRIKNEDLNSDKRAKLMATYLSALGQQLPPDSSFTLVALTIGRETYLLPEYNELSDNISRAAILFHEALWVRNPHLLLSYVMAAEIAVENLLRSSLLNDKLIYDFDLFQVLKVALGDIHMGIIGATMKDFEKGSVILKLPKDNNTIQTISLKSSTISIKTLLGETTVKALEVEPILNKDLLLGYWYYLKKYNPNLRFINELIVLKNSFDLYIITGNDSENNAMNCLSYSWDDIGNEVFDLSESIKARIYYENFRSYYPAAEVDRYIAPPGICTNYSNGLCNSYDGENIVGFFAQKGSVNKNGNRAMVFSALRPWQM